MEDNNQDAIVDDEKVYGKKTVAVPTPSPNIGLEDEHSVVNDILSVSDSSQIDSSVLNSFLDVSKRRDSQYKIIDQMCDDSIPSAILELCTEDTTSTNDDNKIVWATSDDPLIQKTTNYILESFQVNKNIPKWANSLIKYGDVYLRLYRESEYKSDPIFDNKVSKGKSKKSLNEDINVHLNKKGDHFVNYAEMIDNPATMFELTRFGKTAGYIQTHLPEDNQIYGTQQFGVSTYKYSFKFRDIDVYQENQFVHGCLENNVDRISEEVEIIKEDPSKVNTKDGQKKETSTSYKVRSGRSFFYSAFRVWRMLSLLQTSLILNRVTKSSIVRILQIEVGNIDKLETGQILQALKEKIEQKMALNPGNSMSEYNNPGPIENTIYVPTHDGKGAITASQLGGDYDPKQLTDIDYLNNMLFGTFGLPKQFFGFTDDGAGFNGGASLTIISSRYAKKILKIQAALTEMVKTLVNIIYMDRGLVKYVNKFTINMTRPITQEDIDRTEAESNRFRVISDTLSLFSDIENKESRLKILKELLPQITDNSDIIDIVDAEIEKATGETIETTPNTPPNNEREFSDDRSLDLDKALDLDSEETIDIETPPAEVEEEGETLPTPGETGVDLVTGTGEEEA